MKAQKVTYTGLFAAIIFIFTFTFKIPAGSMLGYAHLGDMFIIISAWILGKKYAPIAAGIGAAFADLASGFAMWILPTMVIKFGMAFIIGLIAENVFKGSYKGYLVGTVLGAVFHIAGYSLAWVLVGGMGAAVGAFIPLTIQTLIGLVLGNLIVFNFSHTTLGQRIQSRARGELA